MLGPFFTSRRAVRPDRLSTWIVTVASVLIWLGGGPAARSAESGRLPNIIVILIDDMGYADIGPFGARATPLPIWIGWPGKDAFSPISTFPRRCARPRGPV